jgi:hypothetical protein
VPEGAGSPARKVHVVLDNYCIHRSDLVKRILAELRDKSVLHFLPPYCPDHNRIERVWLDLHANVTRNHRCKSMRQLLSNVRVFLSNYRWSRVSHRRPHGARGDALETAVLCLQAQQFSRPGWAHPTEVGWHLQQQCRHGFPMSIVTPPVCEPIKTLCQMQRASSRDVGGSHAQRPCHFAPIHSTSEQKNDVTPLMQNLLARLSRQGQYSTPAQGAQFRVISCVPDLQMIRALATRISIERYSQHLQRSGITNADLAF